MARYLKPSMMNEEHVRRITLFSPVLGKSSYGMARMELQPGEQLVLELDKLTTKIYPVVDSQTMYDNFYEQYGKGLFMNIVFLAVRSDELEQLTNSGG